METGEQRHVSARAIANAAGPWVMQAAGCIGGFQTARKLRLVNGSHIVVPPAMAGGAWLFPADRAMAA